MSAGKEAPRAPLHNAEIAALFERLADLLEIEGGNPFRVRAYRNAAQVIASLSHELADLVAAGEDLSRYPGIGEHIAEKIAVIVETGELPQLEEARRRTPDALSDLMHVRGLGPARVKQLYHELGVRSVEDLRRALTSGKVRELEGFGEKSEKNLKEALARLQTGERRLRLADAESFARGLVDHLRGLDGVKEVEVAGSYRRRRATVGDLDILVTCKRGTPVMERFVEYPEIAEVVSRGETRSTVRLRSGLQVDLRVVPQVAFGAAMHYFTGSKAHNVAVRTLGQKRDLKINEYGVFRGEERVAGRTEEEVFAQVGLPWIPPELRENRGEIEAARDGMLPSLIALDHVRGDLHAHTNVTDGHDTLERMARAAAERGYEYLAITDHSRRVTMAHGLDADRLAKQIEAVDRLNDDLEGVTLLKGVEVDILDDGQLDLPDDVLEPLDLTVCAVHYRFNLSRDKQTDRIIRAMDNPHFNILAHPTGRLINEREAYEVDIERVMEAARERGCHLEVNAQPSRLDLADTFCRLAKETGVRVAVSTDAHAAEQLDHMRHGVDEARRGWLEPDDVINTRSLKDVRALLKRR